MTGFGSSSERWKGWSILVEARSVNGRYFDFSLRCPDELRVLEPALRQAAGTMIERGKVDMRIALRRDPDSPAPLALNHAAITQLHHLINQLPWDISEHRAPAPLELLRFPGVLIETDAADQHLLQDKVRECAQRAVAALHVARRDEGRKLDLFLRTRLQWIHGLLDELHLQAGQHTAVYEQRLRDRIMLVTEEFRNAMDPVELAQRIALEVSMHGMRIDVAEEIARIQSHVHQVLRVLDSGGTCGKRLDFLMQELHREANTLGSKSTAVKQSHAAIDLKVWIEQMREQIQNME